MYYDIALTLVEGIGTIIASNLTEHFGSAEAVFKADAQAIAAVQHVGIHKADAIKSFASWHLVDNILQHASQHHIHILTKAHSQYPEKLLHCYDAPTVLYYQGNLNALNALKSVSIIGTRTPTEYGKWATEKLVATLKNHQATVFSGMAFGIDAAAHEQALQQQLPTIGVVAHGLHTIYPHQHKPLATKMLDAGGGLLTEFDIFTKPDKHNFPRRNRIVAAIADALVVVETAARGGSMITAELASNYGREVFAVPGRWNDKKSEGCLYLIQHNKATVLPIPEQLTNLLGWQRKKSPPQQQLLPIDLSETETAVLQALQYEVATHIDALHLLVQCNSSDVAAALLSLELMGLIAAKPGKLFVRI